MPVPSQGHYGFHSLPVVDSYEFWFSLGKIVRSSVILLLPLFQVLHHFRKRPFSSPVCKCLWQNVSANLMDVNNYDIFLYISLILQSFLTSQKYKYSWQNRGNSRVQIIMILLHNCSSNLRHAKSSFKSHSWKLLLWNDPHKKYFFKSPACT